MSQSILTSRVVAGALLVVAAIACAVILLGRDEQTLNARFLNADGLVTGGRVEVAGRKVGSIDDIALSSDGLALVRLSIDDGDLIPLHVGTRAAIRAVGQAGLANRYVDLRPGPAGATELADGATLSTQQTSGIVNLDALLGSFGPANRRRFQGLIAHSAEIYTGSGAASFNDMLGSLSPATREFATITRELALDRAAISELIDTAATTSTAVAERSDDLTSALDNAAVSFGALTEDRAALYGALSNAPTALAQATGTLARTRTAVNALRPALRDVPAAAVPLRRFLTRTDSLLRNAGPAFTQLTTQLPLLDEALTELPPLERPLVRTLGTTGTAMHTLTPIFRTTRYYGADLILGVFSGLLGIVTGPYDARGHYGKLNFIQSSQTTTSGPLAELLQDNPLAPGLLDTRTKLTRRCPGGLNPPAPDGSSPWDLGDEICTHEHDIQPEVNEP
jgi:phospholipid/cholesterol/gamma-HCH transport system substrate-binding protein